MSNDCETKLSEMAADCSTGQLTPSICLQSRALLQFPCAAWNMCGEFSGAELLSKPFQFAGQKSRSLSSIVL